MSDHKPIHVPTFHRPAEPVKPALPPDTQHLIMYLRQMAAELEAGASIEVEKPRVRAIVDLVMKLAGHNAIVRGLVVNSKYLR